MPPGQRSQLLRRGPRVVRRQQGLGVRVRQPVMLGDVSGPGHLPLRRQPAGRRLQDGDQTRPDAHVPRGFRGSRPLLHVARRQMEAEQGPLRVLRAADQVLHAVAPSSRLGLVPPGVQEALQRPAGDLRAFPSQDPRHGMGRDGGVPVGRVQSVRPPLQPHPDGQEGARVAGEEGVLRSRGFGVQSADGEVGGGDGGRAEEAHEVGGVVAATD
mmetsp:Transcript_27343/g.62775  ORF Transcript_27343/g.62775 Transcript_27343/m.62775 type:complete len:213 (-) Transcript_27343:200-838(-)